MTGIGGSENTSQMIRSRVKVSLALGCSQPTQTEEPQRETLDAAAARQTETFGEVCNATPEGSALASVLGVRLDSQHAVQLLHRVSQQILQVADEAVDVTLARRLVDDVLVVVVAQASAQLLVVHLRLVLPLSPATGHLRITAVLERLKTHLL